MSDQGSPSELEGTDDGGGIHRPIRPVARRWRRLLVVADGSAESELAVRFAAMRASHLTGGGLILFHAIQEEGFEHWMTVADRMRAEAMAEAEDLLKVQAEKVKSLTGMEPEKVIVEGQPHIEIAKLVKQRDDIFALVLGTNSESDPDDMLSQFTREVLGKLTCPIMIIPESMTIEQIDNIA